MSLLSKLFGSVHPALDPDVKAALTVNTDNSVNSGILNKLHDVFDTSLEADISSIPQINVVPPVTEVNRVSPPFGDSNFHWNERGQPVDADNNLAFGPLVPIATPLGPPKGIDISELIKRYGEAPHFNGLHDETPAGLDEAEEACFKKLQEKHKNEGSFSINFSDLEGYNKASMKALMDLWSRSGLIAPNGIPIPAVPKVDVSGI